MFGGKLPSYPTRQVMYIDVQVLSGPFPNSCLRYGWSKSVKLARRLLWNFLLPTHGCIWAKCSVPIRRSNQSMKKTTVLVIQILYSHHVNPSCFWASHGPVQLGCLVGRCSFCCGTIPNLRQAVGPIGKLQDPKTQSSRGVMTTCRSSRCSLRIPVGS